MLHLPELKTLLIVTRLQPITMSPYSHWVHPSFRQTLVNYCDEFLRTNDRGTEKTWSKLITQVSQEITDIVKGQEDVNVPDDLEKVLPPSDVNVLVNY
jgi:hypothetical protein